MLKQRIITAVILIPLVLIALFLTSDLVFGILSAVVFLIGALEWTTLMELHHFYGRLLYALVLLGILILVLFIPFQWIFLVSGIWWILALIGVIFYPRGSERWGRSMLLRGLMGILVLMPCWVAVNYIRSENVYTLLFLFLLIWGADISAYIIGKRWGEHKFLPLVSPGKSIEGLLAALIFTMIFVLIILFVDNINVYLWPKVILLCVITVLFSVVGDLFESMMKRNIGLKDASHLLPGHGGLLDRIDSLTAAAPIFTLGAMLLANYL